MKMQRSPALIPAGLALGAMLGLGLAGCGGGTKDVDAKRAGAKPIAAIGVDTDKVDFEGGDITDYKLLSVPTRGILSVRVHWDNPRIQGRVTLKDKFGVILETKERNSGTNTDAFDRPVLPGVYFIELTADEGSSVYSVETNFASATGAEDGSDDEPVPYCVELMEGGDDAGAKKGGGGADSGGGGAAAAAPPAAAMAPPPPGMMMAPPGMMMAPGMAPPPGMAMAPGMAPMAPPAAAPGFDSGGGGGGLFDEYPEPPGPKQALLGAVLRVAESGGRAQITIDKGQGDGVRKGVRGDILSASNRPIAGGRFVVVKVYDRSCKAESEIGADSVPDLANVSLEIPR